MRVAVITVSDRASRGEREDQTGPALREVIEEEGHTVVAVEVVPDEREAVAARIRALGGSADVVLTTGGTGVSPRDVTPEAARDVMEREIPGIAEEMRRLSVQEMGPRGMLSRAVAGVLPGGAILVTLPGSPGGAYQCWVDVRKAVFHAAEVARGGVRDCAKEE